MVRSGLDAVRTEGLRVLPLCPFVAAFLAEPEHAAYLDLVEPHIRAAFRLPVVGRA